eukprot:gb/GEZN01002292.1/.p1 GENE.gb/GEZN01002292.1/~~gb/GEZN01002292.1/.p1  ORF type:complete len:730 (-),score=48.03 gb/GEZN01002292.1/:256-2445(-)
MILSLIFVCCRRMDFFSTAQMLTAPQVSAAVLAFLLAMIVHTLQKDNVVDVSKHVPGIELARRMDYCNCLLFGWLAFREVASMYLVPLKGFRARFVMVAVLVFNALYAAYNLQCTPRVFCLDEERLRCFLPHRLMVHWLVGNSGFIMMQAFYLDHTDQIYGRLLNVLAANAIMLYGGFLWLSTPHVILRNFCLFIASLGFFAVIRYQTLLQTSMASEIPDIRRLLAVHVALSWSLYPVVAFLGDSKYFGYWTQHALFSMLEMPSKAWFVELVYQGHLKLLDTRATMRRRKLQNWMGAQYQFFMSATHELRNPLHACVGLTELLENQLSEDVRPFASEDVRTLASNLQSGESWPQQEAVSQLQSVLSHMCRTVNDLLDLGSLETGVDFKLNDEAFTLRDVVNDAILITQYRQQSVGGKVVATFCAGSDRVVLTDKHRLRQILINIVDNGLKFTPRGGTLDVSASLVRVPRDPPEGDSWAIHVVVQDYGVGLSSEQVNQLFKPFTQLHTDTVQGGTGLGLNLCHRLVQCMGGMLTVSSEGLGHGAKFEIRMPVQVVEEEAQPESQGEILQSGIHSSAISDGRGYSPVFSTRSLEPSNRPALDSHEVICLVVDDNSINVRLLVRQLLRLGMQKANILTALSGADGLTVFQQKRIDVVFLDLHLGDMLGDALRVKMREYAQSRDWVPCHIIAYTAAALGREKHADYDYVILKPAKFDDLQRWWKHCSQGSSSL